MSLKSFNSRIQSFCLALAALCFAGAAYAHDPGNLNAYTIDRSNDGVKEKVVQVQAVLTRMLRGGKAPAHWPGSELTGLLHDMDDLKEDTDLSLDHLTGEGINIQSDAALKQYPLAGRTVAASRAVETAAALLQHAASLDSQDAFVKEVYSRGLAFYMYDLLGAYRDKMDLYALLMKQKNDGQSGSD